MARKRYRASAARKGSRLAHRWGVYLVAATLLLLGVAGVSSQLLSASATPEPAVSDALSAVPLPANGEVVGNAPAGDDGARTLNLYGGGMRPLVEERDGVQTLNIYGPGGRIIAQVVRYGQGSEEVRYLLTDHLGSTRVVLDAEGNAVARYEYAPHGETTAAGTAAGEVRYRYTGHPYDEEQGVYETPARGYDPTLGRFLSVDPQRETGSPYTYVTNNPVLYKDPNGKGRVGTTITPQIRNLAKKLAAETFEFESNSRLMWKINDPAVKEWFVAFEGLYKQSPRLFDYFVNKIIHIEEVPNGDVLSLRETFWELRGAAPKLPRVNAERRVKIMSNMKEWRRGVGRHHAYEEQQPRVLTNEFKGDRDAYYRSTQALDGLRGATGSDESGPTAKKGYGYGNCEVVAHCIAGQIAETDPEVNVEVFKARRSIDHAFAVVGRDPTTNASKPMTWNKSAMIVDGWNNLVEPAQEYYAQGRNTEFFDPKISLEVLFTFK